MDNVAKLLLNKYFEENSIVKSNIDSFNNFIEKELQNIIDEIAKLGYSATAAS